MLLHGSWFGMDKTCEISKSQKLNAPSHEHNVPLYCCKDRMFLMSFTTLRCMRFPHGAL